MRVFYDVAKPHAMMFIRINDAHDGFMRPKNEKHHMYIWVLVGELAYVHTRPQLVTWVLRSFRWKVCGLANDEAHARWIIFL